MGRRENLHSFVYLLTAKHETRLVLALFSIITCSLMIFPLLLLLPLLGHFSLAPWIWLHLVLVLYSLSSASLESTSRESTLPLYWGIFISALGLPLILQVPCASSLTPLELSFLISKLMVVSYISKITTPPPKLSNALVAVTLLSQVLHSYQLLSL